MNIYDALIFDLDGTLWSTVQVCTAAWNEVLKSEKKITKQVTVADLASIMGLTIEQVRQKFFTDLSKAEGDRILNRCFDNEVIFLKKDGGTLYPYVEEGIKELSQHFKLFVVSNCEVPYMEAFLSTSGLKSYFKDWECHGATRLSKGENIVNLMKRNNIKKAIFVGDTMGDQVAASHAKIPFAFVEYGFGICTKYDFKFDNFRQLVCTFLELRCAFESAQQE
jgi:phosphoglycolate phosphatase